MFQSRRKSRSVTVNKNKVIDAKLKKWGLRVAMILLVADVAVFLFGITAPSRKLRSEMTPDQWNRIQEMRRLEENMSNMAP